MSIERIHPEEPGAVALLDRAITALTTALDDMPIGEVVNLKAKVATIQTATRELGMSKEAQELATEAVRRSEWALGRAIRKGQAEGEIAKQGPAPDFSQGEVKRVTDFGTTGELYARDGKPGILTIADELPTTEQFDAALGEAKAEGNLSRANVARKAREKAAPVQQAPRDQRKSLPDAFHRQVGNVGERTRSLGRAVDALVSQTEDDRWRKNSERVGHVGHLNDLRRTQAEAERLAEQLQRVMNAVATAGGHEPTNSEATPPPFHG